MAQNYAAAIEALTALPPGPKDYLANVRLGYLSYLAGGHANAAKYYDRAAQEATAALEPRIGCLLPLIALQNYADVEVVARQALKLDALNYYVNLRLAYVNRLQGKLAIAEKTNQHMLTLYPADYGFVIEQALTLAGLMRSDEARGFYQKVLLLSPTDAIAGRALAGAALLKDPMMESFRQSHQAEGEKKYAEAIKVLAHVKIAKSLDYLAADYSTSRKHYENAVNLAPKAVEPLLGLLLPLLADQRYPEAEEKARKARTLDPNQYLANLRLSYALRLQGKLADAEKINDSMLKLYPADTTFLLEQGLTLTGQKKATEARGVFAQVLMLSPYNTTAAQALAEAAAAP